MKIISRFLLLNCLFLHFVSAQTPTSLEKFISSKDKHLNYTGRVGFTTSCAEFYWTGTSVSITVQGTKTIKVVLDTKRDFNYYYAIIDGKTTDLKKIKVGVGKKSYPLVTFSDLKKHRIELIKITNTDDNTTYFYGFEINKNGSVLKPTKEKKKKFEFFGDSISCGHGADVPVDSTDSGAAKYFNNYKTYGAITARHFDAQYHCTAKSGIGLAVSWFPQIMPEIYNRVNPEDPNSKWDFSSYVPDIVVVNLFQNDSWIVNMSENEQLKARFGTEKPTDDFMIKAYANFILKIRSYYPKAQIICCLGNMDIVKKGSKWPEIVEAAVATLKDKKVVTHFFEYKNTNGHPKAKEQQAMADNLIQFIEKNRYLNPKEDTITIKVKNTLKLERSGETVVLTKEFLKVKELSSLGIRDKKSGEIQLTQTVDNDGDGKVDELLFQPKISAKSKKEFSVFKMDENLKPKTQTYCYSRFVPERTDDYAWENDKVAFRTYGPRAQKMIEDKVAGGTLSSGIDAWLKRVDYPILNKWYDKMTSGKGTYHEDTGEGLDNFHVGSSRGIGGTAVKTDSIYTISKNFVSWKTITTGPIRTSFILTYADWDAAGNQISETKKISLDYGNFLSKFEISVLGTNELSTGLTLHDKKGTVGSDFKEGWLSHWETLDDSEIGTGIVVPNQKLIRIENYVTPTPDLSNHYATLKVIDNKIVYYAGFGWKKQGTFATKEAWQSYLRVFAQKINNPLVVTLKK